MDLVLVKAVDIVSLLGHSFRKNEVMSVRRLSGVGLIIALKLSLLKTGVERNF